MRQLEAGQRKNQKCRDGSGKRIEFFCAVYPGDVITDPFNYSIVHQDAPGQECPEQGMKEKEGITLAGDGSGVKEPSELAVPQKEPDPGYSGPAENDLFRLAVELVVEGI
ncbi:hypothetical protein ES708_27872 [subsurface metagenome]